MPDTPQGRDMALKILACRQIYSAKNIKGDPYTIYEIEAQNAQGKTITEKLRSFQALPLGQMIEVSVTVFNSEKHGRSYTLHPKDSSKTSAADQLNELRVTVAELQIRVTRLESGADGAAATTRREQGETQW